MDKKATLTKYSVHQENDQLYLSLTYEIEDDHRIVELKIPQVYLGIRTHDYPHMTHCTLPDGYREHLVHFGAKNYEVGTMDGFGDVVGIGKTIYEKPTELTLEEIEKKLGYKVKIISKEN